MRRKRAIFLLAGILFGAATASAQTGASLRMRDTTITGERPTPDVFFILPAGKGSRIRSPHRRDYREEILQPVVKPWLEKDENVSLAAVQHVSRSHGEWSDALQNAPLDVAPQEPPAPAGARTFSRPSVSRPPVDIPPAARSGGTPGVGIPPAARSAPPPAVGVPSRPSASRSSDPWPAPPPPPSSDVPILVPPQ